MNSKMSYSTDLLLSVSSGEREAYGLVQLCPGFLESDGLAYGMSQLPSRSLQRMC